MAEDEAKAALILISLCVCVHARLTSDMFPSMDSSHRMQAVKRQLQMSTPMTTHWRLVVEHPKNPIICSMYVEIVKSEQS